MRTEKPFDVIHIGRSSPAVGMFVTAFGKPVGRTNTSPQPPGDVQTPAADSTCRRHVAENKREIKIEQKFHRQKKKCISTRGALADSASKSCALYSAADDLRPAMCHRRPWSSPSRPSSRPFAYRTVQGSQHQSSTAANETDQCNNQGVLTAYGVCDAAEEQYARAVVGPRRWQHHRHR